MSFNDGLPYTTPRYEYDGIQHFLEIYEREVEEFERGSSHNPYLIFVIDDRAFFNEFAHIRELRMAWKDYDSRSNQILIQMESSTHATASAVFSRILDAWVSSVTKDYLLPMDSQTIRGPNRTKKADKAWQPGNLPSERSIKWPSIVLEVACSESRRQLEADVEFWLTSSNGDVKIAITLSVQARGRITLEHWDLRPGTQSAQPVQTMSIVRNAAPKCQQIEGSLALDFSGIFLRQKGRDETDFTMTHDMMRELARGIWRAQFGDPV